MKDNGVPLFFLPQNGLHVIHKANCASCHLITSVSTMELINTVVPIAFDSIPFMLNEEIHHVRVADGVHCWN